MRSSAAHSISYASDDFETYEETEEEQKDAAAVPREPRAPSPEQESMARRLSNLWLELSFVLRKKITSDADVAEAEATLGWGLSVLEQVQAIADSTGIRRTALVQVRSRF